MGDLPACSSIGNLTQNSVLKQKVVKISISTESVTLLTDDNKIYQKGTSNGHHFKNNESKGTFVQTVIWADKESEQKIVDVACGLGFSIIATENGLLWGWGNDFLEVHDQASQTPV